MSEFFSPEHIHVMLVHVLMVGLAATLIPLVVAIVLKNRAMMATGLVMATLFAATIPVVMGQGEEAYE
ncbi:MAG: hypothetical protein IT440_11765, partial [Phycisphaeraceae bacterium]|nr:hypothetical protein [Phycisphaeraceae bacterium]